MKTINRVVILMIFGVLLLGLLTYFLLPQEIKWVIGSVIEVPICTYQIADKLGVQPQIGAIRAGIIQTVKIGMTSDEVESSLSQIAPISITNTFIDDEKATNSTIRIKLCDNPIGDVVLFVYYSEDGHLINVVDAYAE